MGYFNFENSPSEKTPLSAENLLAMQRGLMELVFPIGSTYITQSNTNPNSILGFGTWERLKGKVLIGLDENDQDFNAIKKNGGSKKHKHKETLKFESSYTDGTGLRYTIGESVVTGDVYTEETSSMIPYEVVGYMWIRRS